MKRSSSLWDLINYWHHDVTAPGSYIVTTCLWSYYFKIVFVKIIMSLKFYCFIKRCNIPMDERPRRDISDGYRWWCRQCETWKSIREGSFFSRSKLTLQKWLLMMHFWARECPVTDAMDQAEVDSRTAVAICDPVYENVTSGEFYTSCVLFYQCFRKFICSWSSLKWVDLDVPFASYSSLKSIHCLKLKTSKRSGKNSTENY